MTSDTSYDVAVIGGGLAGLALSIQCAKAGYKVVLFEREQYPFHKVCGEYISHESWNFLQELGVPLSDMHLPQISRVLISAPNGKYIEQRLPLGGFGISRYMLEHALAEIAKKEGVIVQENTRAMDVIYRNNQSIVFTNKGEVEAKVVAGTFGKRSNLDVKWKRQFPKEI